MPRQKRCRKGLPLSTHSPSAHMEIFLQNAEERRSNYRMHVSFTAIITSVVIPFGGTYWRRFKWAVQNPFCHYRVMYEVVQNKVRSIYLLFCSPGPLLRLWMSCWLAVVCLHVRLLWILAIITMQVELLLLAMYACQ